LPSVNGHKYRALIAIEYLNYFQILLITLKTH
jgi:hypothetical protein